MHTLQLHKLLTKAKLKKERQHFQVEKRKEIPIIQSLDLTEWHKCLSFFPLPYLIHSILNTEAGHNLNMLKNQVSLKKKRVHELYDHDSFIQLSNLSGFMPGTVFSFTRNSCKLVHFSRRSFHVKFLLLPGSELLWRQFSLVALKWPELIVET